MEARSSDAEQPLGSQDDIGARTPLSYEGAGTPRNEEEQASTPIWAREDVDVDTEPRRARSPPSEAPTTPTGRFPTGSPATPTVGARTRQPLRPLNGRNLFNNAPVSRTRTPRSQTRGVK